MRRRRRGGYQQHAMAAEMPEKHHECMLKCQKSTNL